MTRSQHRGWTSTGMVIRSDDAPQDEAQTVIRVSAHAVERMDVVDKGDGVRVLQFSGWASTRHVDSYGDVIEPEGWDLEYFTNGSRPLYHNHDYKKQIGGVPELHVDSNYGLYVDKGEVVLTPAVEAELLPLMKAGYLRAMSVGFRPIKYELLDPEDETPKWFAPLHYQQQRLMEISLTPMPANAESLLDSKSAAYNARMMADPALRAVAIPYIPWEVRGATSYSALPLAPEDTAWDSRASDTGCREWASSDGSGMMEAMNWNKYRLRFCWVDSAKAKQFGSYKLPYAMVMGGKMTAVWKGVAAAMGALMGSRGGVNIPEGDRQGVYNHLVKYYKRFGKTPPEFKAADAGEVKFHYGEDLLALEDMEPDYSDLEAVEQSEKSLSIQEGTVLTSIPNVETPLEALRLCARAHLVGPTSETELTRAGAYQLPVLGLHSGRLVIDKSLVRLQAARIVAQRDGLTPEQRPLALKQVQALYTAAGMTPPEIGESFHETKFHHGEEDDLTRWRIECDTKALLSGLRCASKNDWKLPGLEDAAKEVAELLTHLCSADDVEGPTSTETADAGEESNADPEAIKAIVEALLEAGVDPDAIGALQLSDLQAVLDALQAPAA